MPKNRLEYQMNDEAGQADTHSVLEQRYNMEDKTQDKVSDK